jgi:hypothetical protein
MEQILSWEANSHSASQEIPSLLWNPKVHYRVHKGPATGPIQSQKHAVHTFPSYFLKNQSNTLSSHLRLCLPRGFFPSGFPTKFLYAFLTPPIPAHIPLIQSNSYTRTLISKLSDFRMVYT